MATLAQKAWGELERWLGTNLIRSEQLRTLLIGTVARTDNALYNNMVSNGLLVDTDGNGTIDSIAAGRVGDFVLELGAWVCPSGRPTETDIDKVGLLIDSAGDEYDSDTDYYDSAPLVAKFLQVSTVAKGLMNGTADPDSAIALLKEGGGALVDAGGKALDNVGFTDPVSKDLRTFVSNSVSGGWQWFEEKVGGLSQSGKRIAAAATGMIAGVGIWKTFGRIPVLGTVVKAALLYLGYMLLTAKDAHGAPFVDGVAKNLFVYNPGEAAFDATTGEVIDPFGTPDAERDLLRREFDVPASGATSPSGKRPAWNPVLEPVV